MFESCAITPRASAIASQPDTPTAAMRVQHHRASLRRAVKLYAALGGLLFFTAAVLLPARALANAPVCSTSSNLTTCRIDQPPVTQHDTDIPGVRFSTGDWITLYADGCVQTGGSGPTWKRYVNPSSDNGLYHGLVELRYDSGADLLPLSRFLTVMGGAGDPGRRAFGNGFLRLGFEDDGYGDNGYDSHDNGTNNQCLTTPTQYGGDAFVVVTIRHDATAPSIDLPSPTPSAGSVVWDVSRTVTLAFSASDNDSGLTSVLCRLDGQPYHACPPSQPATVGDGIHDFWVRAVDLAGNVAEVDRRWEEESPGAATIDSGPATVVPTSVRSAHFAFHSTKTDLPVHFQCALNGGSFGACSGSATEDLGALSDGTHTLQVRPVFTAALDSQQYPGSAASWTWTVDTVPPDTAILASPAPGQTTTDHTPVFRLGASEAAAFECSLDAAPFGPCASSITYTVGDGPHTFSARAIDRAGNIDATPATVRWLVNTGVAPTAQILGTRQMYVGQPTRFTASVVDTTGTPRSYAWSIGGRIVGSGSTLTYASPHIGRLAIALKVTDTSGDVAVAQLVVAVVAPKLHTAFSFTYTFFARYTIFRTMTATKVPSGAQIKIRCKGGGCPFAHRTLQVPTTRLVCKRHHSHCKRQLAPALTNIDLQPLLANRHLAVKTVLTLAVTKPNTIGLISTFTIRPSVAPRVTGPTCLAPGSTKPGKGC